MNTISNDIVDCSNTKCNSNTNIYANVLFYDKMMENERETDVSVVCIVNKIRKKKKKTSD